MKAENLLSRAGPSLSLRLSSWLPVLRGSRLSLVAFAVPLIVRAIPEIIAGPYPIGWDIVAFYIPNSLDLAAGKMSVWSVITSPPVMYAIVVPVYVLSKASLFQIFKILGPVLFGGLAWSIFRFCRRRLFWPERKALFGALFISIYFIMLRISWDAYQLELGLTFLLLSLSMNQTTRTVRSGVGQAALLSLAVLSNQLTGVLVFGYAVFFVLRRSTGGLVRRVLVQFTPLALFLLVLYATFQTPLGPGLTVFGPELAPSNFTYNVAFLFYAYLFVIPLMLLGSRLVAKPVFTPWLLVCGVGLFLSVLEGHVFQDIGYRWALMLSIPLLLVAYEGYTRLKILEVKINIAGWIRVARILTAVGLAGSAALYIGLPSQLASSYFTIFPEYIPTSMLQSSLPLSDSPNVVSAMLWINLHLNGDSVLVAHEAFYGWARVYLSPDQHVVSTLLASPTSVLDEVDMNMHIFTVWWVQGSGWFVNEFPVGWKPVHAFGDIMVYQYR